MLHAVAGSEDEYAS